MACSVAGRNGYAAIRVSIVGNVFYHSKGLTGCTGGPLVSGPAGRHRWPVARHVSGPAGRHRWPSPVARHPLAGCSSADPLAVTGCTSRQRTRCTSADPLAVTAGRLLVTFERHPLAVTGCTSPAGRLLVSGPAGRHRWPVARHVSGPVAPLPSPAGRLLVTFERHPLAGCSSPVARHPLAGCSSADPLAVTRWPVARQRTVAPLAVTGCTSPAGRLLVSGPAGRHRWPVARHVCTSPVARHVSGPLHVSGYPLAVTGCTSPAGRLHVSGPAGRHRWPVARHVSGPAGLRYNRHYQDAGYNRFRRRDSER